MAAEELGPLPAGRHGLSREQVAHSQRERLIAAFAEMVVEHGYHATTITHITAAASVSRRAFYQQFPDKEAAFVAAFDVVVEHLQTLIVTATEPIPDWPHRVIAAFRTLLEFLAAEPALARLCLVESLSAGPVVAEKFQATVDGFAPLLEPGRSERRSERPLPPGTETSLIGAIASTISRSIIAGKTTELPELLPDFAEFALTPYLGAEQAQRLAATAA